MTFDEHGYLTPYNLISTTTEHMNRIFVQDFPQSTTRSGIFAAFERYISELQKVLQSPPEIWIDVSFTTLTTNPRDIDFVIFVDKQLAITHQVLIRQLRQRRYKKNALTDGYFVEVVPETHPDYRIYQFNRTDKHRDFAFDRLGNPKGYLQLLLQ